MSSSVKTFLCCFSFLLDCQPWVWVHVCFYCHYNCSALCIIATLYVFLCFIIIIIMAALWSTQRSYFTDQDGTYASMEGWVLTTRLPGKLGDLKIVLNAKQRGISCSKRKGGYDCSHKSEFLESIFSSLILKWVSNLYHGKFTGLAGKPDSADYLSGVINSPAGLSFLSINGGKYL